MRLRSTVALLALVGAPLALASGCTQSCNQACLMRAQYIDNCLEQWSPGLTWSYTGYDSAETWTAVCQAEYSDALKYASLEGQAAMRQYCSNDIADIWQANTCFDYSPSYSAGLLSMDQQPGIPTAGGSHTYQLRPDEDALGQE